MLFVFFFLNIFSSEQNKIIDSYCFNKFFYCSSVQRDSKVKSRNFCLNLYHTDSAFSHVFNLMDSKIKKSEEKNIFSQDILKEHYKNNFSFFSSFFSEQKFFYQKLYDFFSLDLIDLFPVDYYLSPNFNVGRFQFEAGDCSDNFISKNKGLILNEQLKLWKVFFDHLKIHDQSISLNKNLEFDFKAEGFDYNSYVSFLINEKNSNESYLRVSGNCNGLALYCYLFSLLKAKYFRASHVFAIGAVKSSGEIGGVGSYYNKIIFSIVFVVNAILQKELLAEDILFLLPLKYRPIFDKIFFYFESRFNLKINRFYIKHVKDMEKEEAGLLTAEPKMQLKLDTQNSAFNFFSSLDFEREVDLFLSDNEISMIDIYSDLICNLKEIYGIEEEHSWSNWGKKFMAYLGLENKKNRDRSLLIALIYSLHSNNFLTKEEKSSFLHCNFNKDEIVNLLSFFEEGDKLIEFFYER